MKPVGDHAVVLGAGIGGLLAARVVGEHYEHVTVIERDALSDAVMPRRAVPQGRHAHGLLLSGQLCLEQLLPGVIGELRAAGAVTYRALTQVRFMVGGHWLARADVGRDSLLASRPFIEGHIRRRVSALGNVEIIQECDAMGLIADGGHRRVNGVTIRRRAPGSTSQLLGADLVVAATGRAARLGGWLQALGYQRPLEQRLLVDLAYASQPLRLPEGALGADKFVLIAPRPGIARGLALLAQEGNKWLLTVAGYAGDHPPATREGMIAFAASIAPADVIAAIRQAEPTDEVARFRFPASTRRFYERLREWPAGLVPLGDAICAFNPVYGQGMSVAARQAVALRTALATAPDRFEPHYLRAAGRIASHAWKLTAAADLAQSAVPGPRSRATRLTSAYLRRVHASAAHDTHVAHAFVRVSGMLDRPHALLRPAIARRVLFPLPQNRAHPAAKLAPPVAQT